MGKSEKSKLNVVLIMVDQMRRDCLGVAGHPVVETPYLDMMKRHGVSFDKAYTAVPSCIASRAALLTGLSQRSHGRTGYRDGVTWDYAVTLPSELAKAGYQTECVGKMHVHPARNLCGFHHVQLHDGYLHFGRDADKATRETYAATDDYLHWLKQRKGVDADLLDSGLECNSWMARPFPYEEEVHPTNWCITQSIDFLRRRDPGKPFFLMTSFVRPHSPLDPPQYYFDLYDRQALPMPVVGDWAKHDDPEHCGLDVNTESGILSERALHRAQAGYYGSISHIDHQIGRLVQAIAENGRLNDTVFLFASDHGDMMGEHNLFRKVVPYEGSTGIPLILYDPGDNLHIQHDRCDDTLIELRDILPTILDMTDTPIPDVVEGRSILPILRSEKKALREYIHGEHDGGRHANHFIVTQRDKFILFTATGMEQYFDLASDPCELHNAIADPTCQDRVSYLRGLLQKEMAH